MGVMFRDKSKFSITEMIKRKGADTETSSCIVPDLGSQNCVKMVCSDPVLKPS